MNSPIPIVSVILQNEKKEILFLKRANTHYECDKWCLPGGKINIGQRAEEACITEIKEETGLDILNLKFLFYRDNMPNAPEGLHCLVLYFKADCSGNIKINEESSEFQWINPNELEKIEIAFNQAEAVSNFAKIGP